mmetsp:Transcript_18805/g.48048  ORF Transcript_18805/g.48048 Transcript_18805/m.48048 type:complete len:204 (-) Transcript_18805:540-1151(-)
MGPRNASQSVTQLLEIGHNRTPQHIVSHMPDCQLAVPPAARCHAFLVETPLQPDSKLSVVCKPLQRWTGWGQARKIADSSGCPSRQDCTMAYAIVNGKAIPFSIPQADARVIRRGEEQRRFVRREAHAADCERMSTTRGDWSALATQVVHSNHAIDGCSRKAVRIVPRPVYAEHLAASTPHNERCAGPSCNIPQSDSTISRST